MHPMGLQATSKVGKRGAVVIPAPLRRLYGIEDGSLLIAEATAQGILLRPAVAVPRDEPYAPGPPPAPPTPSPRRRHGRGAPRPPAGEGSA
jgi:AbrB family looped-hinge helix DNA binding protein